MSRVTLSKDKLRRAVAGRLRESLINIGSDLVTDVKDSMVNFSASTAGLRSRAQVASGRTNARGSGRVYMIKGVRHRSSPPGSPPAPFTHRLKDSIMFYTSFGDRSNQGPAVQRGDNIKKPKGNMWTKHLVVVGTNVPYAAALEHGTPSIKPRPYLWPALKRARQNIKDRLNYNSPFTGTGI